jgi:hypothetical protein
MIVLREYEDFYNAHRPHCALKQAAPLRPLPDGVVDLDHFRVQRRDRAGGVIHEYRLVALVFGTHRVKLSLRTAASSPLPGGESAGCSAGPKGCQTDLPLVCRRGWR